MSSDFGAAGEYGTILSGDLLFIFLRRQRRCSNYQVKSAKSAVLLRSILAVRRPRLVGTRIQKIDPGLGRVTLGAHPRSRLRQRQPPRESSRLGVPERP